MINKKNKFIHFERKFLYVWRLFSIFVLIIILGKMVLLNSLSAPITLNEKYDYYNKIFLLREGTRKEIIFLCENTSPVPLFKNKFCGYAVSLGELNLNQNLNQEISISDSVIVTIIRANAEFETLNQTS